MKYQKNEPLLEQFLQLKEHKYFSPFQLIYFAYI